MIISNFSNSFSKEKNIIPFFLGIFFLLFPYSISSNDMLDEKPYVWFDEAVPQTIYLKSNLIAQFGSPLNQKKLMNLGNNVIKHYEGITIVKVDQLNFNRFLMTSKKRSYEENWSPIFVRQKGSNHFMALPGGIILYLDPKMEGDDLKIWAKKRGITLEKKLSIFRKNAWLIKSPIGLESLLLANELRKDPQVKGAMPNWWEPHNLK